MCGDKGARTVIDTEREGENVCVRVRACACVCVRARACVCVCVCGEPSTTILTIPSV